MEPEYKTLEDIEKKFKVIYHWILPDNLQSYEIPKNHTDEFATQEIVVVESKNYKDDCYIFVRTNYPKHFRGPQSMSNFNILIAHLLKTNINEDKTTYNKSR
jgi:hypothetical protein